MRAVCGVVLILCGTLLVLAPALVDFMDRISIAALLAERTDLNSISLSPQPMAVGYRMVCWLLGGAMILIGTAGGMFGRPCLPPPPPPRDTPR